MERLRRLSGWGTVVTAVVVSLMCFGLALGDAGVEIEAETEGTAPLFKEIERLKTQVGSLEGILKEKDSSLEKKDVHIGVIETELEALKEQKEDNVLSKLELELESMVVKAKELEAKVASATEESEKARQQAKALKKRVEEAEQSVRDIQAKYDKAQKSFLESKQRAEKAEKALEIAEATITQAEKQLHAHGEELSRVYQQWLPPWAATQIALLRARAQAKWSSHAKPHVDALYKHASGKAAAAHAYVKPHIDTIKSSVGPEAQKHWKTVSDSVAPHVELIRSKTLKGYDVVTKEYLGKAQEFLQPHLNTVIESGRPYVAVIQEHTRPYVDQLSTVSKPYLDRGREFLNPYFEKVSPYYRDAVSAAVKHHETLQETVRENLSKYGVGSSVVTQEVVWFLASALLALPVFTALLLFSSSFGGKRKKPTKRSPTPPSSGTGTKHRRAKKVDK